MLGLVLLLISSIKLHAPGFLAHSAWLTLGRVRPAGMNALLYGFASQTAIGVMLWLFCRLGGNRLALPGTTIAGAALWNIAVTLGVAGIMAGASTGFEWLEMPRSITLLLLAAYALMGAAAGVTFHFRRERTLYVSQWYLLAALFWFPWIYSCASLLLLFWPVRGTVQSVVNAWFANNLLGIWLGPVALAALFYFIPKLVVRPLYNLWLAFFGFWTLAFFTNWAGLTVLVGGPVPAWMTSVSIAANVLLCVPLLASALNWHLTLRGAYHTARDKTVMQYMFFGAAAYLLPSAAWILLSFRSVSAWTHFTFLESAQRQLLLLGFVGMTLLGSMHYIVPRLLQRNWTPQRLNLHFLLSAGGIALLYLAQCVSGIVQSVKLAEPTIPFINIVKATVPFGGLATLGWLLLLAGQLQFLAQLFSLLLKPLPAWRATVLDMLSSQPVQTTEVKP